MALSSLPRLPSQSNCGQGENYEARSSTRRRGDESSTPRLDDLRRPPIGGYAVEESEGQRRHPCIERGWKPALRPREDSAGGARGSARRRTLFRRYDRYRAAEL